MEQSTLDQTQQNAAPKAHGFIASIATQNGLSVFVKGQSHIVTRDHRNYDKIVEAIREKDPDKVLALIDVKEAVNQWALTLDNTDFELRGSILFFKGRPFTEAVSNKILAMAQEGMDPSALLNFLRKVKNNPASSAQRELLMFCAANDFMIHEDGDVIAYKSVRENYYDVHSGTIFNKPAYLLSDEERSQLPTVMSGADVFIDNESGNLTVQMPRGDVDDDRHRTCSFGLHFAAFEYASGFGGSQRRVVVVKINPADVVAIPSDYNNQKGRCARYEVVAEREDVAPLPAKAVYTTEDLGCPETKEAGAAMAAEQKSVTERTETVKALIPLLAAQSMTYFTDDLDARNEQGTLVTTSLADLAIYGEISLERLKEEVQQEFDLDSLDITEGTTVNEIVDKILAAELLSNENLYDEEEEGSRLDDEDDEEDNDDPSEEEVKDAIEAVQRKIVARVVHDSITFRDAFDSEGIDLDNVSDDVVQQIKDAGLHAWF